MSEERRSCGLWEIQHHRYFNHILLATVNLAFAVLFLASSGGRDVM
ncbi:MAG TPA: hypothetical protein PLI05_06590 [Methanotrichaceae archaeon]|nr:MAG: hypothetical protein A4E47_00528 [Methanosaeta sp. PtaU1.Bin028]HOT06820.1 hypothetical protein [Methanotrichaceae archaeon]HQF16716.1 hypothetical protein [Methanotrichaceae archaeon]HQI91348.1 hypothetical protein [Methanotrichaceae archaeon]HQJ28686.1 hypothetical protein [Methanotrichaceae archaeon]